MNLGTINITHAKKADNDSVYGQVLLRPDGTMLFRQHLGWPSKHLKPRTATDPPRTIEEQWKEKVVNEDFWQHFVKITEAEFNQLWGDALARE